MKALVCTGHCAVSDAIGVYRADCETGIIERVGTVKSSSSTYLAFSKKGSFCYVADADEVTAPKGKNGRIVCYRICDEGGLKFVSALPTGAAPACHLSLAEDGQSLAWADYGFGRSGRVALNKVGLPVSQSPIAQHVGDGPNKPRQDRAHTHCARYTPDGKYICAVDLGIDEIRLYCNDSSFTFHSSFVTSPRGAGPRHIIFHPNGRLAFVVFELENLVASYRYHDGNFELVRRLSTLPGDFTGRSKASAILLAHDGKRLFVTNRGYDSMAVYDIDPSSGEMILVKIVKFDAKFPWDIDFLPSGKFLAVAFETSGLLRTYRYDEKECSFEKVGEAACPNRPFCVKCCPMVL